MRDDSDKTIWGQVEKVGKGTRANYDPDKKTVTFCFKRAPETSAEQLRAVVDRMTPDGGPSFVVLEGRGDDYAQVAGGEEQRRREAGGHDDQS